MPVARNMKELEKMVLDRMKKELPNATKEYCHKWYNNNSDIKEIVSETEFIQIANDAMHISMENGKLKAHIELFKGENIKEEHLGHMKILWEDFKSGCGNPKHPTNMNEKLAIQALYPCGFIVRDRGGIVVFGGKYELSMENAIRFVKNYIPTEKEKHYTNLYQVPMSIRKKRQLAMCYKILEKYGLHYKNEHNYFFWVLDKRGNVISGGKNGFGFKWLLSYCRKLKYKPLPKRE